MPPADDAAADQPSDKPAHLDADRHSLSSTKSESASSSLSLKERLQSRFNAFFRRSKSEKKTPTPLAHVKVRLNKKSDCEFDSLLFVQDLSETNIRDQVNASCASLTSSNVSVASSHSGRSQSTIPQRRISSAIWALQFSPDSKYLAAAGQEGIIWVWEVADTLTSLYEPTANASILYGGREPKALAVFKEAPTASFHGHTSDILDLCWSANNFLLSCSTDKTVKIWHTSRNDCLATFEHPDYVTAVQFHPKDDRCFLSGSLDGRLRIWNVPEKSCITSRLIPDSLVTAVSFAAQGKIAIAGTLTGKCFFFETEGLKYNTQLQIKESSNAKMEKITGIHSIASPFSYGNEKIMVSSNDSRVRIYHLRDKSIAAQFKGLENSTGQLKANISNDGLYVISGSENRKVYIWNNVLDDDQSIAVGMYATHDALDSTSTMASIDTESIASETRSLDSKSLRHRFHFNNPLKTKKIKESLTAAFRKNRSQRYEFFQAHASRVTAAIFAPALVKARMRRILDDNGYALPLKEDEPASTSQDAIIVSSDVDGHIKVFMNCRHIPGVCLDEQDAQTGEPDQAPSNSSAPLARRLSGSSLSKVAADQSVS